MSENPPATPANPAREGQRVAKVIARAGLCSRRDAEGWILEGRVSVNGKVLESPAFNVGATDEIRVDGQPLKEAERTRLFLFHKPRGLVTTARDPEGRPTIFDSLSEDLPRVVAVGRLDINSEGLILLTNDGGLARVLELPATGWLRRYRVRAHGAIEQARLDALAAGVTIDGIHYAGIEARLEREQGSNVWIMMGLREGKNREIKRVLEHLGLSVNRLIRVSFGPFELGDLAEGEVAEVRTRALRDQLGAKLAREAGVNFDLDVVDRAAPAPPPPAPKRVDRRWTGGRERPDRGGAEPRGAAQRREPEPSQPPRKRKHISALRAETERSAAGPRRRIERGATADRRGRKIEVERIVATPEELRRRAAETARRDRSRHRGVERQEERRASSSPDRRGGKRFGKRASPGEGRPPREGGRRFGERPPPSGEGRSPPRGAGGPFEKRASSGEGRPPSREGGRPSGKRPPSSERRPFEKRASSGEGRPPREGGKPNGKRPPSGEGRAPRGGKPGGKRPPRRP